MLNKVYKYSTQKRYNIKNYLKYYQYIKTINDGQCKGSTYKISGNKLKKFLETENFNLVLTKGLMGKGDANIGDHNLF